jgi:hypothetical protein
MEFYGSVSDSKVNLSCYHASAASSCCILETSFFVVQLPQLNILVQRSGMVTRIRLL